jgi:hypothetical protein
VFFITAGIVWTALIHTIQATEPSETTRLDAWYCIERTAAADVEFLRSKGAVNAALEKLALYTNIGICGPGEIPNGTNLVIEENSTDVSICERRVLAEQEFTVYYPPVLSHC